MEVASISVREPTLEDVYIHYTGRRIRDELERDSRIKGIARRFKH